MHLLAIDEALSWAANWSQIFSITAPFVGAWIIWSARKWVENITADMIERLEERTNPIQPGANGGKSLPDAITLLDRVDTKIDSVHDRIDELHEKVNGVARDFEHLRGRFDQHMDDAR